MLTRFTLAVAALASLTSAAPTLLGSLFPGLTQGQCLSQTQANLIVKRYAAVIAAQPSDLGSPTVTAQKIAAEGKLCASSFMLTQLRY